LIDELTYTYYTCNSQNCRPVLLLVDEAGRTAIPSLSEFATTINGRGISLWIAIQSLSQLDAVYGRARARILRDNMDSQIYYRPCDQETAEYIAKCLEVQSGFAQSESTHGEVTSNGRSEREIPLMTAQAIKQMTDEEIIFFHRNLAPVKARAWTGAASRCLESGGILHHLNSLYFLRLKAPFRKEQNPGKPSRPLLTPPFLNGGGETPTLPT
jgi:type IV secretory pathway TraG/TraD family ATPase VirD4